MMCVAFATNSCSHTRLLTASASTFTALSDYILWRLVGEKKAFQLSVSACSRGSCEMTCKETEAGCFQQNSE